MQGPHSWYIRDILEPESLRYRKNIIMDVLKGLIDTFLGFTCMEHGN